MPLLEGTRDRVMAARLAHNQEVLVQIQVPPPIFILSLLGVFLCGIDRRDDKRYKYHDYYRLIISKEL